MSDLARPMLAELTRLALDHPHVAQRALIKRPALLILDEATSALDAATQKKAAANIAIEQKRLGFSIVQIAHRLETLTNSDVVYFLRHGQVVEKCVTDDQSAVEKLLKVSIKYENVTDPESGEPVKQLVEGHFHQMWNLAHEMQVRRLPILPSFMTSSNLVPGARAPLHLCRTLKR